MFLFLNFVQSLSFERKLLKKGGQQNPQPPFVPKRGLQPHPVSFSILGEGKLSSGRTALRQHFGMALEPVPLRGSPWFFLMAAHSFVIDTIFDGIFYLAALDG